MHESGAITDVVVHLSLNAFLFRSSNNVRFLSLVETSDGCRKTWTRAAGRLFMLPSARIEVCAFDLLHLILLAVVHA